MQHLLLASVLTSLFSLSVMADDLTYEDLRSTEGQYLQSEQFYLDQEAAVLANEESNREDLLELNYADQYERSLFSLGEVDVERKITLNGGGKTLRADAFELGFHIAVNYTP